MLKVILLILTQTLTLSVTNTLFRKVSVCQTTMNTSNNNNNYDLKIEKYKKIKKKLKEFSNTFSFTFQLDILKI